MDTVTYRVYVVADYACVLVCFSGEEFTEERFTAGGEAEGMETVSQF